MSEYLVCPRPACAEVNALIARFCWRCGGRLTEPPLRQGDTTERGRRALAQVVDRLGAGETNTATNLRPPAARTHSSVADDAAGVAVELGTMASQPDGLDSDAVRH